MSRWDDQIPSVIESYIRRGWGGEIENENEDEKEEAEEEEEEEEMS